MNKKLFLTLCVLSPVFWFLLLLSLSLFLFYWRIANEPGVAEPINLLFSQRLILGLSLACTAAINILFIKFREKRAWIAWVANLSVTLLYVPLLILTLLMMA